MISNKYIWLHDAIMIISKYPKFLSWHGGTKGCSLEKHGPSLIIKNATRTQSGHYPDIIRALRCINTHLLAHWYRTSDLYISCCLVKQTNGLLKPFLQIHNLELSAQPIFWLSMVKLLPNHNIVTHSYSFRQFEFHNIIL